MRWARATSRSRSAVAVAGCVVSVVALVGCGASPSAAPVAPPVSAASSAPPPVPAAVDASAPQDAPEPTSPPAPSAAIPLAGGAARSTPGEAPRAPRGSLETLVDDARAAGALARVDFPWRRILPGWSIAFLPERAGLRGLTKVDERRIEIFVRDADTADSLARIVAHELGHALDVELNSTSDRERWRAVRGVGADVEWWPGNAMSDFETLAGDFAEAVATWLTGSPSQSRVAPPPGPAALAVLAELVFGL